MDAHNLVGPRAPQAPSTTNERRAVHNTAAMLRKRLGAAVLIFGIGVIGVCVSFAVAYDRLVVSSINTTQSLVSLTEQQALTTALRDSLQNPSDHAGHRRLTREWLATYEHTRSVIQALCQKSSRCQTSGEHNILVEVDAIADQLRHPHSGSRVGEINESAVYLAAAQAWFARLPSRLAERALQARDRLAIDAMIIAAFMFLMFYWLMSRLIQQFNAERRLLDEDLATLELFAAASRSSSHAGVITDPHGRVLMVNPAFTHLTGVSAATAQGRLVNEFIGLPATAHATLTDALRHLAGSANEVHETLSPCRSAPPTWTRVSVLPCHDRRGGRIGFSVCALDVTETRRLREALVEQHAMLRTVIDHLPAWVFWKDLEGRIQGCNRAYALAHGYDSPESLVGLFAAKMSQRTNLAEVAVRTDAQVLSTGADVLDLPVAVQLSPDDQRHMRLSKIALRSRHGHITGLVGIAVDVSDIATALESVERTRKRLDVALTSTNIGIVEWSPRSSTLYFSESTSRTLGLETTSDGILSLLNRTAHPQDLQQARRRVRALLRPVTERVEFELRLSLPDRRRRRVLLRLIAVERNARGFATCIVGTITDITELRETEEIVNNSRKLEALGQLAAGVAHEINTPAQFVGDNLRFLAGIMNDFGEVLHEIKTAAAANQAMPPEMVLSLFEQKDIAFASTEAPQAIAQSIEGIERIAGIVRALKDLSHPGTTKVAVDLNHIIRSAVTVATNEWKYSSTVELQLAPDLPQITAIAGDLQQLVLNLIVNAAHAVEQANQTRGREKGLITITTAHYVDHVELRITDDGCGIPEAIQSRVFDAFFTTKPVGKGTGQGLAIVQRVVQKHRGHIELHSQVGAGTTFRITLPNDLNVDSEAA